MSGTNDYQPVPVTNGFTTVVPTPGIEIWKHVGYESSQQTTGQVQKMIRVYPIPAESETGR